jgi:hypothetical protein
MKQPDEVGEAAREHRLDEVGKSPVKRAKGVLICLQTVDNLRNSWLVGVSF